MICIFLYLRDGEKQRDADNIERTTLTFVVDVASESRFVRRARTEVALPAPRTLRYFRHRVRLTQEFRDHRALLI